MWQLLKVLLRLTCDLFALFVQQWDNITTGTELRTGLSAIDELLVHIYVGTVKLS